MKDRHYSPLMDGGPKILMLCHAWDIFEQEGMNLPRWQRLFFFFFFFRGAGGDGGGDAKKLNRNLLGHFGDIQHSCEPEIPLLKMGKDLCTRVLHEALFTIGAERNK